VRFTHEMLQTLGEVIEEEQIEDQQEGQGEEQDSPK
jgi:hypothetical protein